VQICTAILVDTFSRHSIKLHVPTEYYLVLCEQETKFKFSSVIIPMKIN